MWNYRGFPPCHAKRVRGERAAYRSTSYFNVPSLTIPTIAGIPEIAPVMVSKVRPSGNALRVCDSIGDCDVGPGCMLLLLLPGCPPQVPADFDRFI